jgi:hypothetical protein
MVTMCCDAAVTYPSRYQMEPYFFPLFLLFGGGGGGGEGSLIGFLFSFNVFIFINCDIILC